MRFGVALSSYIWAVNETADQQEYTDGHGCVTKEVEKDAQASGSFGDQEALEFPALLQACYL